MDIERLEELREIVLGDIEYLTNLNTYHEPENELLKLIDAEIKRQSVSGDVRDAIEYMRKEKNIADMNIRNYADLTSYENVVHASQRSYNNYAIAIAALEQMLVKEPCEYCGDHVMVLRKVDCEIECPYGVTEDNGECGTKPKCPPNGDPYYECVMDDNNNYCPNCGRKLVE